MPPNSTQNLNAKLSVTQVDRQRTGGPAPSLPRQPLRNSASETKIVGGAPHYRGGYHLNV